MCFYDLRLRCYKSTWETLISSAAVISPTKSCCSWIFRRPGHYVTNQLPLRCDRSKKRLLQATLKKSQKKKYKKTVCCQGDWPCMFSHIYYCCSTCGKLPHVSRFTCTILEWHFGGAFFFALCVELVPSHIIKAAGLLKFHDRILALVLFQSYIHLILILRNQSAAFLPWRLLQATLRSKRWSTESDGETWS